jgi:hypothetical protein
LQKLSLQSFQKEKNICVTKAYSKDPRAKNEPAWLDRIEEFVTSCNMMNEVREKDKESERDKDENDPSTPNTSGPEPHTHTTPVYSTEP